MLAPLPRRTRPWPLYSEGVLAVSFASLLLGSSRRHLSVIEAVRPLDGITHMAGCCRPRVSRTLPKPKALTGLGSCSSLCTPSWIAHLNLLAGCHPQDLGGPHHQ